MVEESSGDEALRKLRQRAMAQPIYTPQTWLGSGYDIAATSDSSIASLLKVAGQGCAEVQYGLGLLLQREGNTEHAVRWYRKAACGGLFQAQRELGLNYIRADGIHEDLSEAARWLRKAARQGCVLSQRDLGALYHANKAASKNKSMAVWWYRKAVKGGCAGAAYALGRIYETGEGVPRNLCRARKWFEKAISLDLSTEAWLAAQLAVYSNAAVKFEGLVEDLADIRRDLADWYQNGPAMVRDPEKAAFWLNKAGR